MIFLFLGFEDSLEPVAQKSVNLKWIRETVPLKKYLKTITEEDLTNSEKAEVLKISLISSLLDLAKAEHLRGNEFPRLLKMEQVRHAISILKRLNGDLNKLQSEMEKAYGLCKGILNNPDLPPLISVIFQLEQIPIIAAFSGEGQKSH